MLLMFLIVFFLYNFYKIFPFIPGSLLIINLIVYKILKSFFSDHVMYITIPLKIKRVFYHLSVPRKVSQDKDKNSYLKIINKLSSDEASWATDETLTQNKSERIKRVHFQCILAVIYSSKNQVPLQFML